MAFAMGLASYGAVITAPKVAAGLLMLFGYFMTGKVHSPPLNINPSLEYDFILALNNFTECGRPSPTLESPKLRVQARILGGLDVVDHSWPWMAYLYLRKFGRIDGYICGGTLIHSHWILTAAHCIPTSDPDAYGVVLGENEIFVDSHDEQIFNITAIYIQSNYSDIETDYNIALLKLSRPVLFTKKLYPVCIPNAEASEVTANPEESGYGNYQTYAESKCTVTGWGQTERKYKSEILQELQVQIIPQPLCELITQGSHRQLYVHPVYSNSTRFCAYGGRGKDTCVGDSGGPLVCLNEAENKYYLHGVTSYGPSPCGQPGLPGVYSQVTYFREWINGILRDTLQK